MSSVLFGFDVNLRLPDGDVQSEDGRTELKTQILTTRFPVTLSVTTRLKKSLCQASLGRFTQLPKGHVL